LGRGGISRGFWRGNLREEEGLADPDIEDTVILNLIFKK
jgi:hypothetical protein